jgi:hypothetical protein
MKFVRIKGTCGRPFDTVNVKKDERHLKVYWENQKRSQWNPGKKDFRVSAFDLFTNWLARECFDDHGNSMGLWRLSMRETYWKTLFTIKYYRKQGKLLQPIPNFLKSGSNK